MRSFRTYSIILLWFAVPVFVQAQERDHEDGFFLRLSAGPGYARTTLRSGGTDMKMSGGEGDINLAIGGMISSNLALHATIFGWVVQDPDVSLSGFSGQANADLDLTAIGPGLTYYIMPENFYISGSVGSGSMSIKGQGGVGETNNGPVFDVTVGKEWWVGSSWGLGVAAGVGFHSLPEKNVSDNWSGFSAGIRFTATLN